MSKKAEAWMPVWIGDYLADTQRLTCEQHGAYLLLIFDYWRNGPPPDNDDTLRSICKLDAKAWQRHRPTLIRMFQVREGEWHHGRIDRELESARDNQDRRSGKAQAAANARWGNASSNALSMPDAIVGECPSPSPSPVIEDDANASSATKRARRLSADWKPFRPYPPKVAELTAQWPDGREDREIDQFRDYWTTRPGGATKLDWEKTWHNRIRDQHDRIMREARNGEYRNGSGSGARSNDGFGKALARAAAVLGPDDDG